MKPFLDKTEIKKTTKVSLVFISSEKVISCCSPSGSRCVWSARRQGNQLGRPVDTEDSYEQRSPLTPSITTNRGRASCQSLHQNFYCNCVQKRMSVCSQMLRTGLFFLICTNQDFNYSPNKCWRWPVSGRQSDKCLHVSCNSIRK